MHRTSAVVVSLSALLVAANVAAQSPGPTTYTFAAEWQIPRAQWASFATDFEKNTRPVLEKLSGDGTLVSWGVYETIVHTEQGPTHGVWWSSTTSAGLEKARGELVKASAASSSLAAATSHRDYYLQTILGQAKSGSGTDAYLSIASYLVKAGQGPEWRQLWEKNSKPTYDDLLAQGLVMSYAIDVESVHTDSPGWRHVVSLAASADAEDKINAAFDAAAAKRSTEERQAMTAAIAATQEPGTHRDGYVKVLRYWQK